MWPYQVPPSDDVKAISFAARALAYGLARMYIDGHFPQWEIPEPEAANAFNSAFDLFVSGIACGGKRK